MGDHRLNPTALAASQPTREMDVADLGDGFALVALSLEPVIQDGKLTAFVVATGCRPSRLVPVTKLVKVAIGKLGEISTDVLKGHIATGLGETWEPVKTEPQ